MGRERISEKPYWGGSSVAETDQLFTKLVSLLFFLTTQLNHTS